MQSWLSLPTVELLDPSPGHLMTFRRLCLEANISSSLVTDTHLAALAKDYQAEIHSHDADFRRFAGLKIYDPLSN